MKKGNVDRNAIEEILGDLETKLTAYLIEWRRELGIQKGRETIIDRKEPRLVATEREEQRR